MTSSETPPSANGSLRVTLDASLADVDTARELVSMALFDAGAQAVGEVPEDDVVLIAGFATIAEANAAQTTIEQTQPQFLLSSEVKSVATSAWVETQRAGLEPTQIGPWHIRAPWDIKPSHVDPAHDIVIDPGVAFGHGAHPSTRLAIELTLRHLSPSPTDASPPRVVDLGTGTGVIAIIAARLGATVRAVENDAAALEVAWRNVEYNSHTPFDGVTDRIELIHGDAADVSVQAADLVVANVTLDVQRMIASTCAPSERVVVSGILCRQVRALQDLYPLHRASTILASGEWAAVELLSTDPCGRKNL